MDARTDWEQRLRDTVAATLAVDVAEITDQSSSETIAAWTSLNHLAVMSAVEEEFGITFAMDEMTGVSSFGDLRRLLAHHYS
jgi:acyl carrier protein